MLYYIVVGVQRAEAGLPQIINNLNINDYVCPIEELDEEREYYLYHFKTQPCTILDPSPTSLCAKDLCAGYVTIV